MTEVQDSLWLPEYRDNPFIARLPSILSTADSVQALGVPAIHEDAERNYPDHIRAHCLLRLKRFFEPLEQHLALEQHFAMLLRQGYVGRNPANGDYIRHLQNNYERIEQQDLTASRHQVGNTAASFALVGCSGVGKTKSMERVLSLYDQVIYHREPFSLHQIVWLKLECPSRGSHKDLCISFFAEVDRLLGTNYLAKYGRSGTAAGAMVVHMAQIASLHAIGVLVIDEIQNIQENSGTTSQDLMAFLVRMVNLVAIPMIFIGTLSALPLLQKDFRQARRASGLGSMVWERMPKNASWDHFIQHMWQLQWTREYSPLDDEIRTALYEESQGIVDVVINLYMLTQKYAIQMRAVRNRPERIDAQLIRYVARENFKIIAPMIAALKSGNLKALSQFDDLLPLHEHVQRLFDTWTLQSTQSESTISARVLVRKPDDTRDKVVEVLVNLGMESAIAGQFVSDALAAHPNADPKELIGRILSNHQAPVPNKAKPTRRQGKPKKDTVLEDDDLRFITKEGRQQGLRAYEALRVRGVIKSPLADFAA
ncbi:ATP-binding protein [Gulbenkiania mobilis]|uniref:AAA domain-containing protein n=1 Tax=Gulbenkiania mobilis TaxID=397457 RepID=A0ABY2D014_GULMO|nr:AAA domain-containing protein [Gulbenkiania mobilis]